MPLAQIKVSPPVPLAREQDLQSACATFKPGRSSTRICRWPGYVRDESRLQPLIVAAEQDATGFNCACASAPPFEIA